MSTEASQYQVTNSSVPVENRCATRSWLLRRICSQNPFYLLSVGFVLHGTAQWFHNDSGVTGMRPQLAKALTEFAQDASHDDSCAEA